MATRQPVPVIINASAYKSACLFVAISGFITFVLMFLPIGIHIGTSLVIRYGFLLWTLWLLYFAKSWQKVEAGELGGIFVLEIPAKEVYRGWHFVPLALAELHTIPLSVQEDQFPADPEKIDKRADEFGLKTDEFRPIRTTTGAPEQGVQNTLNVQMSIEVTFSVRWQIEHGGFFSFYINMPGKGWEGKLAEVRRQMRDTGEGELIEEIGKRPLYRVLNDIEELNNKLESRLESTLHGWSIRTIEARMQAPDISHAVNQALAGIPEARAKAEATVTAATAERERQILTGQGTAEAHKLLLTAEGEGVRDAALALGMSPEDYRAGEIAKATIGEGTLIIGDDGIAKALGIGAAILKKGGMK